MGGAAVRPKSSSTGRSALVFLVTCLTLLSVTSARPNALRSLRSDVDSELLYAKHSRRSYCVNAAGKCFSSGQCCRGLVCAAIDDYFGQKPEVPGYCVKEKDLEVCAIDADCGVLGRCVPLGRTGERYCLPRRLQDSDENGIESVQQQPQSPVLASFKTTAAGGLGSSCTFNGDCLPTMDQGSRLCCQDVRRGRQGVRRICDRITPISTCIAAPRK